MKSSDLEICWNIISLNDFGRRLSHSHSYCWKLSSLGWRSPFSTQLSLQKKKANPQILATDHFLRELHSVEDALDMFLPIETFHPFKGHRCLFVLNGADRFVQVVQWEDALELIQIAQGLALEVVPQRIDLEKRSWARCKKIR